VKAGVGAFKRPPTDSATENKPPRACRGVRVKRWGKGPPRRGQPRWQGKPNPMQDYVGGRVARSLRLRVSRISLRRGERKFADE